MQRAKSESMEAEKNKDITLEEAIEKLSGIVKELETPGASLEQAFENYTEGVKLIKVCHDLIDKVEKKLIVLEEGEADEQ